MLKDYDILVTNDDNHESPLLHWLIDSLKNDNRLTIVAPAQEKSWTGKGMSCVGVRFVEPATMYGCEAYYVDGLPADCVNIGVHHLCPKKPDLVISGINAGRNTGTSFVMSSGTVGACFEANILQLPGIAISQNFEPELMDQWKKTRELPKNRKAQLKAQVKAALPTIFEYLQVQTDFLKQAITWNVNLPSFWGEQKEIAMAPVNTGYYGSIFIRQEDGFQHFVTKNQIFDGPEKRSDATLIENGIISVSKLNHRNICVTDG